jgi:hypothetical protein
MLIGGNCLSQNPRNLRQRPTHDVDMIKPDIRDDANGRVNHLAFRDALILLFESHTFDDKRLRFPPRGESHDGNLLQNIRVPSPVDMHIAAVVKNQPRICSGDFRDRGNPPRAQARPDEPCDT